MSDDVDKQDTEEGAEESRGPFGGERLANARREQQISVDEIAKELHLDEGKVRALERNEFDVLGAPVFAKGHLRKYAELVNVDADGVLADYDQHERAEELPPVVSTRRRPRQELSPGPWIAVIVVVIVVATAYWWFTSRPMQSETTPNADAPPANDERMIAEPQETDDSMIVVPPETDDSMIVVPPATDEEMVAEPEAVEAPADEPAIADGQLRLLLTYTGDCWTEITDASGRRLFFDLGKDGRSVELSGAEPFNVLFGNPGNVRVRVNGEDFSLPPSIRPGRPLRLSISGT